jgi:hypothetical protein
VPSHLEGDPRSVWIAKAHCLAIADLDHRHPLAIDVDPVEGAVVDPQPPTLLESQQEVSPGHQGMGDPHVSAQITSDDNVVACGERAL